MFFKRLKHNISSNDSYIEYKPKKGIKKILSTLFASSLCVVPVLSSMMNISYADTGIYQGVQYTDDIPTLAKEFIKQWKAGNSPITLNYYGYYSKTAMSNDEVKDVINSLLLEVGEQSINDTTFTTSGDYLTYNWASILYKQTYQSEDYHYLTLEIGKLDPNNSSEDNKQFYSSSDFRAKEQAIQNSINTYIARSGLRNMSEYDRAYEIFNHISNMRFEGTQGEVDTLINDNHGNSRAMALYAYRIYKTLGVNDVRIVTGRIGSFELCTLITKIDGQYYLMNYALESINRTDYAATSTKDFWFARGINSITLDSAFKTDSFLSQYPISTTDYKVSTTTPSTPAPSTPTSSTQTPSTQPPSTEPSSSTTPSIPVEDEYSVIVGNTMKGNMANVNTTLSFTITLKNCTGSYQVISDSENAPKTIVAGTRMKVQIGHNEEIKIVGIPKNATISISRSNTSADGSVYSSPKLSINGVSQTTSTLNSMAITRNMNFQYISSNSRSPQTGVVTKIVPFVIVFVIAGLGIFYLVFKKKK